MDHMKTKPQEKKSAKTLKGQLFGALSMMLVAAIALGTSTYAWFINNRTVEVQNMQLTVSTSTSLLVAVGKKAVVNSTDPMDTADVATNWTGLKSVVMNQDITGVTPEGTAATGDVADWNMYVNDANQYKQNLLTLQMTPASISNRGLVASATGVAPDLTFFLTDNHVANGLLDQFDPIKIGTDAQTVGMGAVKRIPLKFSASSDLDVYFGKDGLAGIADMVAPTNGMTQDQITAMPETSEPEKAAKAEAQKIFDEAAAIRTALRVAIVPQKDADTYTGDVKPVIFQFDAGTAIPGNQNNTDYTYITDVGQIYPNPSDDNAASGADAATQLTAIQKPTEGKYAAIKTVDDDTKHVNAVAIQQTELPADSKCWAAVDNTSGTAVVTPHKTGDTIDGTPIFQLTAGKERMVDVYIWLEGTDEDCLNQLSGYSFNLNLPFAGSETPTPEVTP